MACEPATAHRVMVGEAEGQRKEPELPHVVGESGVEERLLR